MTGDAELPRMARAASLEVRLSLRGMHLLEVRRMELEARMAVAAETALMAAIARLRVLANRLRMFGDPVYPVRALDAMTLIAERGPLRLRMACAAPAWVLLVAGGVKLDPVRRVRSRHVVTVIARVSGVAPQTLLLARLFDFVLVTLDPLGAVEVRPAITQRLVTGSAGVRRFAAVVAGHTHLHRRRVLSGRAPAVGNPGVADDAAYPPVPVLLMGNLGSMIDEQVTSGLVAALTLGVAHPTMRFRRITFRCELLSVFRAESGLDHPGPAGHLVALVTGHVPVRGDVAAADVATHLVARTAHYRAVR